MGGIPSEFKEWSKLAKERSSWRKAMYPNAESLPSRQHLSANRKFHHPLACISPTIRGIRRAILKLQPHLHSIFSLGGLLLLYYITTTQPRNKQKSTNTTIPLNIRNRRQKQKQLLAIESKCTLAAAILSRLCLSFSFAHIT